MPDDGRPDPDALIAAAVAAESGRLKIFLGAAPGVGKTWEMLVQARRRQAEGVDVVAGVVETHGRAGTIAQLDGLPALPLRTVSYRGQALQEFDLDAALARRPGLLLVDELAHTNAPGSRHAKRWEDVALLVRSGLTVWATLNVQHLESLNDDVARVTGVRVTETLPDAVLEMADEIELIDVPPAELRRRLQDGAIYRPETAARALNGFFREGNLASLREMALRRAAAHVDDDVRDWMRRSGVSGAWPSGERVLALIGPGPSGEVVVRQAKRLAEALHAPWVALHVERAQSLTAMQPALALAAQLGATLETRGGGSIVDTALTVAEERNATHIVLGRAGSSPWRRLTGWTLARALMTRSPDLVIHIIPGASGARPRIPRPPQNEPRWTWPAAAALTAAITVAGISFGSVIPASAMGMIYLAGVVAGASVSGMRLTVAMSAASFLAWDYFFIPPLYTVSIGSPDDVIALLVFAAVALLAGGLASRVRTEARAAQGRIEGLRRIGAFSRKLGEAATDTDLLAEVARQAADFAGQALVLAPTAAGDLDIRAAHPHADTMDPGAWAAAQWAWTHAEPTGRGTSTLPGGTWRFMPIGTVRARLGVLGVRSEASLEGPVMQALATLVDQSAVAWERVKLFKESARNTAMEETQRLRTALLASLGHDLRTPLTGIRGAAGTLRSAWDRLEDSTRIDLLDGIEQDVGRMSRFLANITDLTRLESGQISPRLAPVSVAECIDAAAARLPGGPHLGIRIPDPPPYTMADSALLEQILVNVLENAVKYGPAGSLVRVDCYPAGADICIAVTDEGVGIPTADLKHVFDSFFRARSGDRAAAGTGLGLGLAIARGMIEAMGGSIVAQSPRNDAPADGLPGTRVIIRLPAADALVSMDA